MIITRPDMPFVLRILHGLMRDLGAPGAYLILAKTLKELVLIKKDDPRGKDLSTLAIDGAERLYINEEFWRKEIRSEHDAKFVLLHELMHHILGDTAMLRKRAAEKKTIIDDLEGIATDARINALICGMLPPPRPSDGTSLLYRMYKPKSTSGLLRPHSVYSQTDDLYNLYTSLYQDPGVKGYEDILTALKVILAQKVQKTNIQLLGGHGMGTSKAKTEDGEAETEKVGEEEEGLKDMPKEIKDALIGTLMEGAESKTSGYGNDAFSYFVNLLQTQRGIDRKLLKNYSTTHNINQIRAYFRKKTLSRKPIPISPSKRDLLKIAVTGNWPTMWAAPKRKQTHSEFGVAIYLDVSGSVYEYLPKICRLIVSMKKEITCIYGFSNEVHEHGLNMLRKGELKTTGGTDFDCVAEHIEEAGFKKCVIITDGYAGMNNSNAKKMLKQLDKVAIILFEETDNKNNWFSEHFDTFQLDEVVN